jgi:hypothetical protein
MNVQLPQRMDKAAFLHWAQDQMKAWVWTRGPAGFPVGPEVLEGDDAVVRIKALDLDAPLPDVYARVKLD